MLVPCNLDEVVSFTLVACTFTGANEDGGKRRRGHDGYGVNISVPDLVPNPEIFFGHQMGPEQTLRRETWTDRREISVRVSFIFKKQQKMLFVEPGHVKKKKTPLRGTHHNRPRRNLDQNLEISNPEHSKSKSRLPILGKSRNRNFNAILSNFN